MFWYSLQLLSKVFLILGKLQRRDRNVHLSSHKLPAILVRVWGTGWCSWLRHCATSRKVAGSIPDDVIGILHWHNASCRTMALGSTRPLTETSTRNISWGVKAAGAYGWQPYHLHVPIVLKSGSLNLLQPSGPVQACNGIALPFFTLFVRVQSNFNFLDRFFHQSSHIKFHSNPSSGSRVVACGQTDRHDKATSNSRFFQCCERA